MQRLPLAHAAARSGAPPNLAARERALPAPAAVADAARWASRIHARTRRLARARYLETRRFPVTVGVVFPPEASARSLGLFASSRA